jgi:lysozyme family protein
MPLSPEDRTRYEELFQTCAIRPNRRSEVEREAARIAQNRARYQALGDPVGIPWFVIGVIHSLEASLNFGRHLHNGDSLQQRTKNVPRGRPLVGDPPFTWEFSAKDALDCDHLYQKTDWGVAGTLDTLEAYNGLGYRNKGVPSPYLWSFSNHYEKGRYVSDNNYDPESVSEQCGAAVLLKRMHEQGSIVFEAPPVPAFDTTKAPPYSSVKPQDPEAVYAAAALQRWLNSIHSAALVTDGWAGNKTARAFKRATGGDLPGASAAV